MPIASLATAVPKILEEIQRGLIERAVELRRSRSFSLDSYAEFKTRVEDGGFFSMRWCGNPACEAKTKEETKATIRCIPLDAESDPGPCVVCGAASVARRAVFARSY